jgi:serine/threonine-protein kinase
LTGSNIDGRADQYALAGTAFHLLTGAPPFQHENPIAVISQHLHDDPPRLSDYRPDLAQLDDVFFKALAKNPEDRFERCRAFSAAIDEQIAGVADGGWGTEPGIATAGRRTPRRLLGAMTDRFSSRTRWATALVCAVLIAVAATWSVLYSFQPELSQTNPALASRPSAPAASAAPARPGGPTLSGTYQLTYEQGQPTPDRVAIRKDEPTPTGGRFRSACTTNGCAATGTQLDDANHQVASTANGGETDTLRFVAGYWQGAPQQERVGCTQPNGQILATQQDTVAWSLAPQADGTLRGTETQTVVSNECGAQGAVVRIPVVATRVGNVPPAVALADPTLILNTSTAPAHPAPPVLGGLCSDVDNSPTTRPTTSRSSVKAPPGPKPPSRPVFTPPAARATGRAPRCSPCPPRTTATCSNAIRSAGRGPGPPDRTGPPAPDHLSVTGSTLVAWLSPLNIR